jgi:hypothetical protein
MSGCFTSRLNKFVAGQYGNELPPLFKDRNNEIIVTSADPFASGQLSTTVTKTSNMLPMLFYWQWDHQTICTLNPGILVNKFTNTIHIDARRELSEELHGQKLELTIEKLPHIFAFNDKEHMIWAIFHVFDWQKVSIMPSDNEMVVSYRLLNNDNVVKSGEITIPGNENKIDLRMFESWKAATSEYLAQYNYSIARMSHTFINELEKALQAHS